MGAAGAGAGSGGWIGRKGEREREHVDDRAKDHADGGGSAAGSDRADPSCRSCSLFEDSDVYGSRMCLVSRGLSPGIREV